MKHLGMTLDCRVRGQVKISVSDCVNEIIQQFEEIKPNGRGTKSSAAPVNLFVINEDCEKLDPRKVKQFHTTVAKTLFAMKRARPDTCTMIACSST